MVYTTLADLDFDLTDLPPLPRPERVLFATPDHFDVQYVINPHMARHVGTVDHAAARRQWEALRSAYERIGLTTETVPGADGLPDMVFCANQTLPYLNPKDDTQGVILSQMHAPQRRDEVPHFERFFRQQDYEVHGLPPEHGSNFEGMGDALWHPGRYLLWGGYGFRTNLPAYEHISSLLDAPVLALSLADDDFYHLDTCFSLLDADSVLIYPGAFDDKGRALIQHVFDRIVEAPETEARRLFACNAHCPDGEHVFIQRGCTETTRRLNEAGFSPVELDTDEFLKAGGSVFCMKQMFWTK